MANNRGNLVVANKNNLYADSPCFYNNKGHAMICVGKNFAGTPIVNGHNADQYHAIWTSKQTVYTV